MLRKTLSTLALSHARRSGLSVSTSAGRTSTIDSRIVAVTPAACVAKAAATHATRNASHHDARVCT
jgi:hypothetical protein